MPGHAHPRGAEHDPRVDRRPPVARVDASPGPPALAPSAVASSDRPLEPVAVAPDTARGSARVATRPADLLRLQRLAGNAAVAAALRPPRPAPARIPDPARQAPSPAARPGQGHATPTGTTVDAAAATPTDTTVDAPAVTPATVQRGLLDDVVDAAAGAAGGVRDAALQTVRDYARRMPGYELLCVVLARDPVTGQAVPRTATAIIDGFLGLVPRGDALRQQLRDSGAVERAGAWFEQEIPRLGLTWETIRGLFSRAWDALSVTDLLDPAGAWARLSTIFGPPLARLRDFATGAVTQVAEFVFEGAMTAAGGAGAQVMGIVRRAGDVFQTILRDPVGFAGNLVAAVRGGLGQFMTNIGRHLRTGLIGWLTGALGGLVRIPARFDLSGVLGMALELLGLTWANVRGRIVGVVGERAMNGIEQTVEVVGEVRERGLSALTSRIAQFTSGLVETVAGGIRDWVANSVVGAAITKLISMFNPAGAVIQAIVAVYNTVQFFIERAQQLGALANAVFDSISAIASGSLGNAMSAVENALGRTVPVVLGFLSRLIGLGDIAAPVRNIIQRVRTVIDGALDRVVGWIAGLARRVGGAVRGVGGRIRSAVRGGDDSPEGKQERLRRGGDAVVRTLNRWSGRPVSAAVLRPALALVKARYGLTAVELTRSEGRWGAHVVVNPEEDRTSEAESPEAAPAEVAATGTILTVAAPQPEGVVILSQSERDDLEQYWITRAATATDPEKSKFLANAARVKAGVQPTWRASELEVGHLMSPVGPQDQVAWRNRQATPNRPRDHVRPDFAVGSWTYESKRYTLARAGGTASLVRNLLQQYVKRIEHIPPTVQVQSIIVDLRGQNFTRAELTDLRALIFDAVVLAAHNRTAGEWYGRRPPGRDVVQVLINDVDLKD